MLILSELMHVLKGQVNQVSTFSQPALEMEKLLLGFLLGLRTH